ncbi:MAG: tRNA pseudouridine(55) synthase TruB [Candidatus Nealsonbacteria bacterium]|nr:MAG: tRNA pseudouridine(55) synthase TruB [Candidatus Nealsonbacteria bacterium]
MEDILFIDKPKGMSSFDVIRVLRKKLKIKKMGHAGTLDPQATGLLIIGVGKGTKKLKEFAQLSKTYLMEVLIGQRTETGDFEGKVAEEKEVKRVDIKKVKKILKEMEGEIELQVPLYSAVKFKGKPLYKYAREGIKITPPKRRTKIFYLKLLGWKKKGKFFVLKIEMKCQKGTYARSVAEEIGRRLNFPATLKELRRLKIGNFDVSKAKKITEIN